MLLCMAILCGCGGTDIPNTDTDYIYRPPTPPYFPPPTELESQIRWAFWNCLKDEHCPHIGLTGNLSNLADIDDLRVVNIADYSNGHVIHIIYPLFEYVCSDSAYLEAVAGTTDDAVWLGWWDKVYGHCYALRLLFWKEGYLYTLQEAYSLDLLSHKDLSSFANDYCWSNHHVYEPCLNFFNNILSKTEE